MFVRILFFCFSCFLIWVLDWRGGVFSCVGVWIIWVFVFASGDDFAYGLVLVLLYCSELSLLLLVVIVGFYC